MHEHGATITDDIMIKIAKKIYNMSQIYPSHKELQVCHMQRSSDVMHMVEKL